MANVNKPFGLAPRRTVSTTKFNEQGTRYFIPSTDPNAYYIGDVVKSAATADTLGCPGVVYLNAGTDTVRGVIVGVEPANQNSISLVGSALSLENTYIPATKAKDYYVYVIDDPHCIFAIQGDGTATKQTLGHANSNFSLTLAAGATPQSASGTVLASATLDTTSTLNFKAFGLDQIPNNTFAAYAVWLCVPNAHELLGLTTAVAA